ncbi:MAG: signal peptidase I [Planctomycetes bacterium]|nr:signal peptidase I [Planctomycetota bacterium]
MDLHDPSAADWRTMIDGACDSFESAWRTGQQPLIEDHLTQVPGSHRAILLRELLLLEREYRSRLGDPLSSDAYLARFPQHASLVQEVFGDLAEQTKSAETDAYATLPHVPSPARGPGDPGQAVGEASSAGQRFRILRPHAEGGLGQVFVAHDEELHREVALKELQDRHADHAESRSRFVLEAEITGALEHPGIVPVYGLGQYADGRPFYAMRFVRGDSLKQAIETFHRRDKSFAFQPGERSLELRKLLRRFIDVCNAVEYAHSRGVIHRDIKPANVMLGAHGETLVVDWGLAKVIGRQGEHQSTSEITLRPNAASGAVSTQIGSAMGTPAYMSPEQAAGKLDNLGPASDIYSLGATLYHLLTGRAPFEGADVRRILSKVEAGEFTRPRHVTREVPKPLEAVCLKAMARQPERRYPSCRALADDIERWLADEPVSARRESAFARFSRTYRRNGLTLALGTCFVVLNVFMLLQMLIALVSISAARHGTQQELRAGLGRLWDSLLSMTTVQGMGTFVGFTALCIGLIITIDASIIWLIMRWPQQRSISFTRAVGAALLTAFVAVDPQALELAGWSEAAAATVGLVVALPIAFLLLMHTLQAYFFRTCLIMLVVMLVSHVATLGTIYFGGGVVLKLLPVEHCKVTGNAMAPVLLGEHHQGRCAVCGNRAFATHRVAEPRVAPIFATERRDCAFCNYAVPRYDIGLVEEQWAILNSETYAAIQIGDRDAARTLAREINATRTLSPDAFEIIPLEGGEWLVINFVTGDGSKFSDRVEAETFVRAENGSPRHPSGMAPLTSKGRNRLGICQNCLRTTEITNVDPQPHSIDRVFVNKLISPNRWDIIVYSHQVDPKGILVHRVVGLPGETVTIIDGEIRINGATVASPGALAKLRYPMDKYLQRWATAGKPAVLKADEYFVLGDFSLFSADSRTWPEGAPGHTPFAVPRSHIKGVITHIYWPLWRYRQFR